MDDERSIESELRDAPVALVDTSPNGSTESATTPSEAATETAGEAPPDFLTQLARAMQATAGVESARAAEEIDRRSAAHVAKIRARAEGEAARMRDLAGEDRRAIERWAETEQQRIAAERDRRTRELETDLTQSLAEHGRRIDVQIQAVEAVIAKHRSDVERFFGALASEADPVQFAQRAGQRPAFPDLDRLSTTPTDEMGDGQPADGTTRPAAVSEPAPQPAEPAVVGVMDPIARLGLLEHSPEPWDDPNTMLIGDTEPAPQAESGPSIVSPVAERTSGRPDEAIQHEAPAQPSHGGPIGWLRRNLDQEK